MVGMSTAHSEEELLEVTPKTEVNRVPEYQSHKVSDLYDVLDSALVAHIAYVRDGVPIVIPMGFARIDNALVIHGSSGAGMSLLAREGVTVTATVTVLDGLVYEESLFASSLNYRSAMIFGSATLVEGEAKLEALRVISERLMPGRWDETPEPTKKEMAATSVLSIPLDEVSVKLRGGGPDCDPIEGLWTGHVPISMTLGEARTAPGVQAPVSDSVRQAHELFERQMCAPDDRE
ncbi:pyridoxamine 5'-phosphate oxidase family protein [Gordonia jinhuaensis]